MKLAEAQLLVRKTIEEIKKGEAGSLPATPYVVAEVGRRLATVKTWEDRADEPLLQSIRKLVEEELKVRPAPRIVFAPSLDTEEDHVSKSLESVCKLQRRWGGATAR